MARGRRTFRHFLYREVGGKKTIRRLFEKGKEPLYLENARFELAEAPLSVLGSRPQEFKKSITGFSSRCLPKDWPYAKNHVKSGKHKGECIFTGRKEIREAVARANDHGEHVTYDY